MAYLQLVIFGEDDAAALIVDDTLHDLVEIGRVLVEDRAEEAEFGNFMIVLVVRQPAFGYPRCLSAGGPGAEQHHFHNRLEGEIGRASCRESVGRYGSIMVVGVLLQKQLPIDTPHLNKKPQ